MEDNMLIDKKEDMRASSEDITESTPEAEGDLHPHTDHPENAGQPKRKGGRKPIYATSEERKQRNRQAQAAFRERRTEYIKQLEESIRVHETNLHSLQTAHRSAADECLMLRYKNSLLERILLEKGIDVQAELRAKTGSPHLGPTHMGPTVGPPTVQRAIMNRFHQNRRSNSNIAPKLETNQAQAHPPLNSPQGSRPTPPSHHSSPSSHSPGFGAQGVMTPPGSDAQLQMHRAQGLPAPSQLHQHPQHPQQLMKPHGPRGLTATAEQEYESQADMVDDQETNEIGGPAPFPATFQPLPPNPAQHHPGHLQHMASAGESAGSFTQLLDPYDPMLDLDPFGLSASMHFPTQFTFDTSSMR